VVPYGDLQQSRLHTTRSDSSVSMPGSRLQRILWRGCESRTAGREAHETKAEQVARAI
jgi:hypothetical protein